MGDGKLGKDEDTVNQDEDFESNEEDDDDDEDDESLDGLNIDKGKQINQCQNYLHW